MVNKYENSEEYAEREREKEKQKKIAEKIIEETEFFRAVCTEEQKERFESRRLPVQEFHRVLEKYIFKFFDQIEYMPISTQEIPHTVSCMFNESIVHEKKAPVEVTKEENLFIEKLKKTCVPEGMHLWGVQKVVHTEKCIKCGRGIQRVGFRVQVVSEKTDIIYSREFQMNSINS
jgi:hypothetical protein